MSQHTPTGGQGTAGAAPGTAHRSEGGGVAGGGTVFAAVLLSLSGVLAILQGIAAIAEDDVYARVGSYVFEFDLTSWGWIHLVLGIVVTLTGVGLFMHANWARAAGICLAGLSMIANFLWLPYQPWWAITLLAINVFIIWALCTSWSHTAD
ncbi:hypothetical protein OG259_28195 [Streptomyces sp. NBC_00250]|uniref:DUF7144 family membrane protein n=1 Tax=Streptomyces sp. NBC_00250 TaxID=2903641 RepID=UPI002E2806F2|nr:hypothetical protein [Streptomyces sp. NBC_00250]